MSRPGPIEAWSKSRRAAELEAERGSPAAAEMNAALIEQLREDMLGDLQAQLEWANQRHDEVVETLDDLYADHVEFVEAVAVLLAVPSVVPGDDPEDEDHPGVINTEGILAAVTKLQEEMRRAVEAAQKAAA